MKKIVISIINYNKQKYTEDCLLSLDKVALQGLDVHVTIIDNASKEPFTTDKKFHHFTLEIIHNKQNLGFSGGHNMGIRQALQKYADAVLLLNNATTHDPSFLQELIATLYSNDQIGIVTPKVYFSPGTEYYKDRYEKKDLGNVVWYAGGNMDWSTVMSKHHGIDEVDHGQFDQVETTTFASGCCMLIRSEVFHQVGLFDERYFLYFEDTDFNQRVLQQRYKIMYNGSAKIWHVSSSASGGPGNNLHDYFITRNRLLFGMSYAPLRSKIALIRESWRIASSGRPWQKIGVRDFYLRKFGKGSYQSI